MNETEYIRQINERYLNKYQNEFIESMVSSINNTNKDFIPYKKKPKHYILSIYDPLELYYGLLGATNLGIRLPFEDKAIVDKELVAYFNLDQKNPDSIYDKNVVSLKRCIEYSFLNKCLARIESRIGRQIQLYITQHLIEVSYDISNMQSIDAEYLWENLED